MEKSPYDPSPEDAFHRNQKRLKEELSNFESNCSILEMYLAEADLTWDEVRSSSAKSETTAKDVKKFPSNNWLRI